jgi:hypothetical protein
MTKPMVRIHDVLTNEIIDREMTDQEFTQYQADETAYAARLAEEANKVVERQAILKRLGITAEEATLLLGGN